MHTNVGVLKILQREVCEKVFDQGFRHFCGFETEAVSGITVEQIAFATEALECAMNVVRIVKDAGGGSHRRLEPPGA